MGKISLVNKIFKKTGKTINKLLIADIIDEATKYIKDKISKENIFSINNFGTFSIKYRANNSKLRFIPHISLIRMIKSKRSRQRKKS